MENQMKIFNNPAFGAVRTVITENNEPLFCLIDVCQALGLRAGHVKERLEDGVVSTEPLMTAGGIQQVNFVNEDGLYDVILDSRKPEAKQFRKWITSEVLPQIRKTGGYIKTEEDDTPDVIMAKALILAQKTIESQKQQNQILTHTNQILEHNNQMLEQENKKLVSKAEYVDKVLQSTSTYTFTQIAKELNITSAKALYKILVTIGVLYYQSGVYLPYSKYSTQGYWSTRTYTLTDENGNIVRTKNYLVVTEFGRAFLRKKLQLIINELNKN